MAKIKTLIIEDDILSHHLLMCEIKKSKVAPEIDLIKDNPKTVQSGIDAIEEYKPDLVFLDIQLGEENGFNILDKLSSFSFEVIVTTSNDYIEEAEARGLTLLGKPIAAKIIEDVVKEYVAKKTKQLEESTKRKTEQVVLGRVCIATTSGFEVIDENDIIYVKADKNYSEFYCENKKIVASKNLGHYESRLSGNFFRCSKSFIINLHKVQSYKHGRTGIVILSDGVEVDVPESNKKDFQIRMGYE